MANVLVSERQVSQRLSQTHQQRPLAMLFERIERRFSGWRTAVRRFRAESEIRRKLADVDDHLLRDIGLVRTNGRIESIDIQRCLGYRRGY
jgi:uncharacterized protein YjiS (DUF1127 family)